MSMSIVSSIRSKTWGLCRVTYQRIRERIGGMEVKDLLDVGTATGHPLHSIINEIPKSTNVLGIDIDKNYIPACQKLFKDHPNVQIQ